MLKNGESTVGCKSRLHINNPADTARFASFFWPRQGVSYAKLIDIHKKMVGFNHCLLSLRDS